MMLSVILVFRASDHGNETNHTDKLAAGLLLAILILILGVPEMCTSLVNIGVTYSNRCSVVSALAKLEPEKE